MYSATSGGLVTVSDPIRTESISVSVDNGSTIVFSDSVCVTKIQIECNRGSRVVFKSFSSANVVQISCTQQSHVYNLTALDQCIISGDTDCEVLVHVRRTTVTEQHGNVRIHLTSIPFAVYQQIRFYDRQCVLCLEQQATVFAQPCGHSMFCSECDSNMNLNKIHKSCFVCRKPLQALTIR